MNTNITPNDDEVLILRCSAPDGSSYGGFQWPASGPVEAPDWLDDDECGHGLHGWLWGEGDASASQWFDDEHATWHVVRVKISDVRALGGKVKFRRGVVVYSGARARAVEIIQVHAPGRAVIYGTATAGYNGTATAGYNGTATAGDYGTATAGACGTATAGYNGTATAGDYGTATAGAWGTATAGYNGTATAGYKGTATAGSGGAIVLKWWDDGSDRYRLLVGYVGEDGIEPDIAYRVKLIDGKARFVRA